MALTCLREPHNEPVSLTMIKLYLKVDHDAEDDLIAGMLKAARQAVEAYTASSILRQEWRFTVNAGFAAALSDLAYLTGERSRGSKGIELPRSPFIELVADPKIIDEYGVRNVRKYRLESAGRMAKLHFGSEIAQVFNGKGNLQIDFAAGYGQYPSDVPEALRQAVMIVAAQLYEHRIGANDNAGLGVPLNDSVIQLIKPYQVQRIL